MPYSDMTLSLYQILHNITTNFATLDINCMHILEVSIKFPIRSEYLVISFHTYKILHFNWMYLLSVCLVVGFRIKLIISFYSCISTHDIYFFTGFHMNISMKFETEYSREIFIITVFSCCVL